MRDMVYEILDRLSKLDGISIYQMMDKMSKAANYSDGTLVELALQMSINQDRVKRGLKLMERIEPNSKILDEIKEYINTDEVHELFDGSCYL